MLHSDFLNEFYYRKYFNDCTDLEKLDKKMNASSVTAYLGFDITAKSLHAGSLMQLMILRLLQKHGHKPIVLLGSSTTKIGDPSGKDKERDLLNASTITKNKESLRKIFSKFIKFGEGASDAILVDNSEWLSDINYLDFLRDIGRHFSINRMLSFESVKLRLDRQQSLTFLEFNYMILQAYDFTVLNDRYGCELQLGGSDQWGNIINGIELNRKLGQGEVFGLTTPLLTTSSGKKMGKSESGAIWLNEDMLSAYDYWQFWRNTDDKDVEKFLKMFTGLERSEIEKLSKLSGSEINEAKIILANEATALCHGREKADAARSTARETFEEDRRKSSGLPLYSFSGEVLFAIPLYKLIVECKFCKTGGEAKRLILQNAVKLNDSILLIDPLFTLNREMFEGINQIKLSVGKKKHVIVEFARG